MRLPSARVVSLANHPAIQMGRAKKNSPDEVGPGRGLIASPPSDTAIVADTAQVTEASASAEFSQFVAAQDAGSQAISGVTLERKRFEATVHFGPLPSPETLSELVKIYPDAAKIIFANFDAQSHHRREIEKATNSTKNTLAIRGQIIGGLLGGIGLIGSFIVAGMGQGLAGATMVIGVLVTLLYVFVNGRDQQKQELDRKKKVQDQIKQGLPVEKLEDPESLTSEKKDQSPARTAP